MPGVSVRPEWVKKYEEEWMPYLEKEEQNIINIRKRLKAGERISVSYKKPEGGLFTYTPSSANLALEFLNKRLEEIRSEKRRLRRAYKEYKKYESSLSKGSSKEFYEIPIQEPSSPVSFDINIHENRYVPIEQTAPAPKMDIQISGGFYPAVGEEAPKGELITEYNPKEVPPPAPSEVAYEIVSGDTGYVKRGETKQEQLAREARERAGEIFSVPFIMVEELGQTPIELVEMATGREQPPVWRTHEIKTGAGKAAYTGLYLKMISGGGILAEYAAIPHGPYGVTAEVYPVSKGEVDITAKVFKDYKLIAESSAKALKKGGTWVSAGGIETAKAVEPTVGLSKQFLEINKYSRGFSVSFTPEDVVGASIETLRGKKGGIFRGFTSKGDIYAGFYRVSEKMPYDKMGRIVIEGAGAGEKEIQKAVTSVVPDIVEAAAKTKTGIKALPPPATGFGVARAPPGVSGKIKTLETPEVVSEIPKLESKGKVLPPAPKTPTIELEIPKINIAEKIDVGAKTGGGRKTKPPKISDLPAPKIEPVELQKPKILPAVKTGLGEIAKQAGKTSTKTRTTPQTKVEIPPPPKLPSFPRLKPPKFKLDLPGIFSDFGRKKRGKKLGRKYSYTPGFTSALLGIRGAMPKIKKFTGLELRPLPKKTNKKRKRLLKGMARKRKKSSRRRRRK